MDQRFGIGTDGFSYYVRDNKAGRNITSLGAFGRKADAEKARVDHERRVAIWDAR